MSGAALSSASTAKKAVDILEEERRQEKLRKLTKPKKQGWFKSGTEALGSVSASSKGPRSGSRGRDRLPTESTAGVSVSSKAPRSWSRGRDRLPTESTAGVSVSSKAPRSWSRGRDRLPTESTDGVSASSKGSRSWSRGRDRLPTETKGPRSWSKGRIRLPTNSTAGVSASSKMPRSRSLGRARPPTESMPPLEVGASASTRSRSSFVQSSHSPNKLAVVKARAIYTRTNSGPQSLTESTAGAGSKKSAPAIMTAESELVSPGMGGMPPLEVTIETGISFSKRCRLPNDENSFASSSIASSSVGMSFTSDIRSGSLHASHSENQIVDALISGMDDDRMTDVTLVGRDGAKVRATKFILACRSPALQEKLYRDPTQVDIFIGDYGEDAIRAMKEYCHTGAIKASVLMTKKNEEAARGLVELATLAKVYGFEPLYGEADALLRQLIDYSPWLATACYDSAGSETELMEDFLLQFIKGRCPDLLLETSSLKYMSQHRLLILLDGLICSDVEMLKYLEKWIKMKGANLEKVHFLRANAAIRLSLVRLLEDPEMAPRVHSSGIFDLCMVESIDNPSPLVEKEREENGNDYEQDDDPTEIHPSNTYSDTQESRVRISPTTTEIPQTRRMLFGRMMRKTMPSQDSIESSDSVIPRSTLRKCKSEGDALINTDCSLGSSRGDKLSVSFGSIEIREHGRVLVDHPSCADGLALGLDWKHSKKSTVMKVNEYERKRTIEGKRSNKRVGVLSSYDKSLLLRKVGGYKEKELKDAFRTVLYQDTEKELADAFLSMLEQNKNVSAVWTVEQEKEKEITDTFFALLEENKRVSAAA